MTTFKIIKWIETLLRELILKSANQLKPCVSVYNTGIEKWALHWVFSLSRGKVLDQPDTKQMSTFIRNRVNHFEVVHTIIP